MSNLNIVVYCPCACFLIVLLPNTTIDSGGWLILRSISTERTKDICINICVKRRGYFNNKPSRGCHCATLYRKWSCCFISNITLIILKIEFSSFKTPDIIACISNRFNELGLRCIVGRWKALFAVKLQIFSFAWLFCEISRSLVI